MNSREGGDGLRSEADAQALISRIRFTGLTPFGTQLNAKVIEPMVVGPARSNTLKKPVLIIAITDGQPAGEDRGTLFRVILNAHNELSRTRYGPDALSLQIAQVGNDVKARQFLEEIDSHPQIGVCSLLLPFPSSQLSALLMPTSFSFFRVSSIAPATTSLKRKH